MVQIHYLGRILSWSLVAAKASQNFSVLNVQNLHGAIGVVQALMLWGADSNTVSQAQFKAGCGTDIGYREVAGPRDEGRPNSKQLFLIGISCWLYRYPYLG